MPGIMTFYFSDTVVLLFDFWSVHSPTEAHVPLQELLCRMQEGPSGLGMGTSSNSVPTRPWQFLPLEPSPGFYLLWFWFHVAQTLFHVLQVVLGYMVMLAVMSYNAWIFLGAIAGSTLGYFMVYPLLGRG
uniref:Copper transport protein n=1 Tax=Zonotrichia albicollis TaxID=44394 RepID=A0A8D2QDC3_ZONAL